MNISHPSSRQTIDREGGSDAQAIDRFEDEGGHGLVTNTQLRTREGIDSGPVVVTSGATSHAFKVHHRQIPDLQADGCTPSEAATNLAQDLAREIESVADARRRGLFERALGDVRAFVSQSQDT